MHYLDLTMPKLVLKYKETLIKRNVLLYASIDS